MTGRAVSIADIDLNIFTGRMGIARMRLSQKGSNAPAVEFERFDLRVAVNSLLGNNIRIREIILTAPTLHVTRLTLYRFDFSDLLDLIPPPDPKAPPSTKTITIERVLLTRGTIVARDESVTPPAAWRMDGARGRRRVHHHAARCPPGPTERERQDQRHGAVGRRRRRRRAQRARSPRA